MARKNRKQVEQPANVETTKAETQASSAPTVPSEQPSGPVTAEQVAAQVPKAQPVPGTIQANERAYTELLAMAPDAVVAGQAKQAQQGAYSHAMQAALIIEQECGGDLALAARMFDATFGKLEGNIQWNRGGLAVTFGAQPRDKATKDGKTHTLPDSVRTAGTTLRFALSHGVSVVKDGKPISFGMVRKANTAVREKITAEKQANATGTEGAHYRIQAMLAKVIALGDAITAEELAFLSDSFTDVLSAVNARIEAKKAEIAALAKKAA